MAGHKKSQLALPANLSPSKQICCFCNLNVDNELEFGKFYHYNGIVTHYYCLLLSSNMEQKGSDDQGILGFLAEDIQKEIKRGKRLVCSHCKKNGATLGCCNVKCKRIFHLPCGLKAGSLHQFFGEFRSYCTNHRPRQKIDDKVKKEIEKMSNIMCYICYEEVKPLDSNGTLWAPCCKKNAWFHRRCVQQLAMSAGYFFKCPLCNNKREFQTAMLEYGIFIPRQDASWELVPNAFEELLYRHDRCDSEMCECPKGRTYSSSNGKWELILCRTCGSQGIHVFCGQLKWSNPTWDCPECMTVLKKNAEKTNDDSMSTSNDVSRQSGNMLARGNDDDEDSDSDISVGNEMAVGNSLVDSSLADSSLSNKAVTDLSQVKLRPGPKSSKLKQVQKMQQVIGSVSSSNSNAAAASNSAVLSRDSSNSTANVKPILSDDIVCLDSDDDTPQILCESTMRDTSLGSKRIAPFGFFNQVKSVDQPKPTNLGATRSALVPSVDLTNSPSSHMCLPQDDTDDDDDSSPFNIIISNVTSVPADFFADEMEESSEPSNTPVSSQEAAEQTASQKRPRLNEDDDDVQVLIESTKRARLDQESAVEAASSSNSVAVSQIAVIGTAATSSLSNVGKVSATAATEDGSSGMSHDNCHRDAGSSLDKRDTGSIDPRDATTGDFGKPTADAKPKLSSDTSAADSPASFSPRKQPKPLHAVLESSPTATSQGGSSCGESSESRITTADRTRLIPNIVCLSDLKFKVFGEDIEICVGDCKIQVKKKGTIEQAMNGKSDDNAASYSSSTSGGDRISPLLSASGNVTSDKSSSKPNSLRCDDSSVVESVPNLRHLRSRGLKNFVYEDDNTLLEYPTTNVEASARLLRKSGKHSRNDLKENWDPDASSSSNNNVLEDLQSNNNNNNNNHHQQTSSLDLKNGYNSFDKLSKQEGNSSLAKREDSNSSTNQRLLRRSGRSVRYFRSVKSANGDQSDSSATNFLSQTVEKSNQNDQSTRNTRSQKHSNPDSHKLREQEKHLKNVDMNDLRFDLAGKVNVKRDSTEIDAEKDFRVSIDLQKIKNFICAKPDLFLKTQHSGATSGRLHVYNSDVKLRVELRMGKKIFLTKAQSFDCLLDLATHDDSQGLSRVRCKSLEDLSLIAGTNSNTCINNSKLTDKRDCVEKKKVRRSQRYKSKLTDKLECVR